MMRRGAGLVGREYEQAVLRARLAGLRHGEGGLLMLVGEAGVGKTRLLADLADQARRAGTPVLTGHAVEGCGPHRPVAEALAGHLRDGSVDLDGELRPYRAALGSLLPGAGPPTIALGASVDPVLVLGEGLLRLLVTVSGDGGCLLVLEDLHWADPETLALLEYLAGAAQHGRTLIAASVRDEQLPAALRRVLDRPEVDRVPVPRMDEAAATALAARCPGADRLPADVLSAVVQRAEGLPLLVEELVASALDPGAGGPAVPPTLHARVATRLDRLCREERVVVEAAAVLGPEPDWTLVAPVTDLPPEVVTSALRRVCGDLLVLEDGRLRWRHALTRDAVLATVLPADRTRLAARAADLVLRGSDPQARSRAADLLLVAGDDAKAVRLLLDQVAEDLTRGSLRTAEATLRRAAGTAAHPTDVALARVRLATLQGQPHAALRLGTPLLGRVDGQAHVELRLALAAAAAAAGRWEQAAAHTVAADRPADPRALVLAADAAFGRGDLASAADLADAAVTAAEQRNAPAQLCAALMAAGRAASRRDPVRASEAFGRAVGLATEHGLLPERIEALLMVGTLDLLASATSPALVQARELALDAGLLAQALSADLLLIDGRLGAQGPRSVAASAAAVAGQARRLGLPALQAVAELYVAAAATWSGDDGLAGEVLADAAGRPAATVEVTALGPAVRALGRVAAHDLDGAVALLDASLPTLARHGSAAPVPVWGLWALLRTVREADGAVAREELRRSPAVLRRLNSGALHLAEAVAAGRQGGALRAREHLAAGEAELTGHDWWAGLLRLLVLEAAAQDRWLDPVPALRAELARHEQAGEPDLARTCRNLLRVCGAPVHHTRRGIVVPPHLARLGLTSREVDVLDLVVRGLTNREIAEHLQLSPRTVDTHVARLLAKTGAADRRGLSVRTAQHP